MKNANRGEKLEVRKWIPAFAGMTVVFFLLFTFPKAAFASTLSLSPSGVDIAVGGTTSVAVRLNTGGEAVNAVSAFLSYPQDKLDVAWVSAGGAFAIEAEKSFGGGIIKISRGNINPVTGSVTVATIGFKGKALGSATVAFIGGSAAPRASDSSDSLNLGGSRGGVYNVVKAAPATPKPTASAGQVGGETAPRLQISQVTVSSISTSSATVAWKTNIPADSLVEYGLEKGKYFLSVTDNRLVTNHSLTIAGGELTPGLTLHFRVHSKDEAGNIVLSEESSFQLKQLQKAQSQSSKIPKWELFVLINLAALIIVGLAFYFYRRRRGRGGEKDNSPPINNSS